MMLKIGIAGDLRQWIEKEINKQKNYQMHSGLPRLEDEEEQSLQKMSRTNTQTVDEWSKVHQDDVLRAPRFAT